MERVVESKLKRYFLYSHLGELQVRASFLDAELVVVLHGRVGRFLHKQRRQMRRRVTDKMRYLGERYSALKIVLHKQDAFLDNIFYLNIFDFPVLRQVPDGGKEVYEAKADIFEVVGAVAHFEVLEHAFKQHKSVLIAAGGRLFYSYHFPNDGAKQVHILSFEVNPVNAPWVVQVGAVGVRLSLGNDKHLMSGQVMLLSAALYPPFSFFAVDKDALGGARYPFAVVVFCVGVVSDMRHVQLPCNIVVALQLPYAVGYHNCFFAFEAVCERFRSHAV